MEDDLKYGFFKDKANINKYLAEFEDIGKLEDIVDAISYDADGDAVILKTTKGLYCFKAGDEGTNYPTPVDKSEVWYLGWEGKKSEHLEVTVLKNVLEKNDHPEDEAIAHYTSGRNPSVLTLTEIKEFKRWDDPS